MRKFAYAVLASWALCLACSAQEAEWLTDLRKDVFSSPQFVAYAKTNLVLVDIDFPVHKEQTEELKKANQALAEKFGVEGYPTVVVLSTDGNELKKETGYSGQRAKEFIAELERLRKKDKT